MEAGSKRYRAVPLQKKQLLLSTTMKIQKARQANFELVRIFAMFLIVLWHIRVHYMEGMQSLNPTVGKTMGMLMSLISFHVDLFILISGYFGIRNSKRGIIRNLIICIFYLWSINVVELATGNPLDWREIFLPVSHNPWWFMRCYFMLVMIAPFLEVLFFHLETSKKKVFLATMLLLDVYFGFIQRAGVIYIDGYDLITMITVYTIGANLRTLQKCNTLKLICLWGGGSLSVRCSV